MSSFAGLNTALTSLHAHRQALEVAGQNIANVNTPGYTRQRATLESIEGSAPASMYSTGRTTPGGVNVVSIDRLGDVFLETRLRQESSATGYLDAVAGAWSLLESAIAEPSENGLAAQLDTFFTSWEDVGNRPDDGAARAVLLENAQTLVTSVAGAYRDVAAQWESARARADALVTEVNTAAEAVADLNGRIRSITVSGGTPNDLMDQRGQLLGRLATLVGGEVRERADGTVDVMVGGNALVRGESVAAVEITATSARSFADFTRGAPVSLVWADGARAVGASGGQLAGTLTTLGDAGPLAATAQKYNDLAASLAARVNGLHTTGTDRAGDPGGPFFTFRQADGTPYDPDTTPPPPAALTLAVAVTDPDRVAAAHPDHGPLDGSVADSIGRLATEIGGQWSQMVVDLGVQTRSATRRAEASEATRANAEAQLLSRTGVDLDEETMQLLVSQRAYEAAARVMTTIDQTLDTLINRTGVVGR